MFKYVRGGTYEMGFSQKEETQAYTLSDNPRLTFSEMRPVHSVTVSDMLVSVVPLTNRVASKYINIEFGSGFENYPAIIRFKEAEILARSFNAEIPSEDLWEYFCRAGSSDLFVFGENIPNDDELERWLAFDCSDINKLNKNKFGLGGLFYGEWCKDFFKKDYEPSAKRTKERVVRGGGAYFWPWQDEEWVWCVSAMRFPESDLVEPVSCVRPVIQIEM
jgi:formylglycine-generating enzyme required for sulfatase activity